MVFPLYDDNTDRGRTPFVNYALIAINVFVFVVLQRLGSNEQFTYALSTVPYEIVTGRDVVVPTPVPVYLTLLTSMFMHGGILHLAGNMLFL
ncbi:MAG TPA: rhomboid family intramembrane serine protease, partial [Pyrinomonadaceae bacterium]|nr:rhomboid family intramembrane serine protease [Pyrinomonadaceae bacterium]